MAPSSNFGSDITGYDYCVFHEIIHYEVLDS